MLLDSNIIIYSFQSSYNYLQIFVQKNNTCCSAISQVEVLGYPYISEDEKYYLEACFNTMIVHPVTNQVIQLAVNLRQQRKMSLGDAIIAATAITHQQILVTRNVSDFDWIDGLNVVNPIKIIQ